MLIGVVSDTHGHVENTRRAAVMLESLGVEMVWHCGDIGSVEIPPLLAAWPAHYVFGNCDVDETPLQSAILASGGTCHGRFGQVEVAGRRAALIHSDDRTLFRKTCLSGEWNIVCYGHSHLAEQHREGQTLVLNPGALYRANPHSLAVLDPETLEAHVITLEAA